MRVGGLGEFESLRKVVQKDEKKSQPSQSANRAERAVRQDEIELSPSARAFGKLKQIPDVRQERLAEIRAKMEEGTLVTPERVKDGIRSMLEDMLSGQDAL